MIDKWMQSDKEIIEIIAWQQLTEVKTPFDEAYQCQSRDVFQAKLDFFYQQTNNPLLVAVAGEIGNNSFDHNLGQWKDIAGIYFKYFADKSLFVIADRGQGIRQTLSRIITDIKSDKHALEIAFTKTISGRSPEHRGNGLKFVASAVKNDKWELYFQSGNGLAKINNNGLALLNDEKKTYGCLAILKF